MLANIVPHSKAPLAASAAAAHWAVATGTPIWAYFVTAVVSLVSVWITLYISGRRAKADRKRDDLKRNEDFDRQEVRRAADFARVDAKAASEADAQRASTRERMIGVARIVEDRLYIQSQLGGHPIEGYAPFERFLTVAYASEVIAFVAHERISKEYFEALATWEQATGALRYGLEKVAEFEKDNPSFAVIETERAIAIKAAEGALDATLKIRALFGDTDELKRYEFRISDLAHSVREEHRMKAEIEEAERAVREANRSSS